MSFKDCIKNKRVVFVGAAPNLTGTGRGEFIDKFDIVCRSNGSIFLLHPESFPGVNKTQVEKEIFRKDYGSRCDVLYTNNQFQREHGHELGCLESLGVRFLRGKVYNSNVLDVLRGSKLKPDLITDAIKKVNETVKTALMGCYIVQDILDAEPAELYVTGIDFFASKNPVFKKDDYREYLPGYLSDRIREQGNKINAGKTSDGHDQLSNTLFFYQKYLEGKISMHFDTLALMKKIVGVEK